LVRRRVTSRTWPGALLIRIPFDRQAIRLNRALEKHIPKGVTALLNEQQYDPVPRDAYLDVFYPSGIDGIAKAMPTIVWVHGGAWISGRKDYTARTSRSSRRAAIVLSRSANQTVAFLLAYPEIARAAALLMRIPFDRQAIRLNRALEKHVAS
jgi:hypothetical protein